MSVHYYLLITSIITSKYILLLLSFVYPALATENQNELEEGIEMETRGVGKERWPNQTKTFI